MKTKLLLLAVSAAAFSSCTTMYKSGQTPDDVYYSPARNYGEAVAAAKPEREDDGPVSYYTTEDRMIRLGINDYRWRYLDDYSYSPYSFYNNGYNSYNSHFYYGSSYGYGAYNNFYSPYNNFYYNDYYYNPYYSAYPVYITPVTTIKNSTPRMTNLNGYTRNNYNNANRPLISSPGTAPVRTYNNSNSRTSGLGNILNKVFTPSNNSSTNNSSNNTSNRNTTPERTYTPPPASSNSSSGSSSSGSSSGGRITRPN